MSRLTANGRALAEMIRLTASGLARAELCLGSVLLNGFDESGEYAFTGNVVDRYVQTAKTRSKKAALAEAPVDLRPYLESLTIERIPDGAEYQVAFALNAITGEVRRIPGRGAGYPTDMGSEWIFGTSDIVGVRGARVMVYDIKWGLATIGRDPAEDLQLGFYAVCAATVASVDEADVAFARAGWDGRLVPEEATLDSFALDALRARIVRIWHRAQDTTTPRLHVGEHCTYCPARRGCPAMVAPAAMILRGDVAQLAATADEAPTAIRDRILALTVEERGQVYEVCDVIEDRAKLIRRIIRDDARQAPIPLSGGKELREVRWGARRASEAHQAREAALEAEGRASGEVQTVKCAQVRPMKAAR